MQSNKEAIQNPGALCSSALTHGVALPGGTRHKILVGVGSGINRPAISQFQYPWVMLWVTLSPILGEGWDSNSYP